MPSLENVQQLFSLYAESMEKLRGNFDSDTDMEISYQTFLQEFLSCSDHLVLVEEVEGEWISGLRAIAYRPGCWFFEAVETRPDARRRGYGEALLRHTIDYLQSLGMKEVTCTIAKSNLASMVLHSKCGFVATEEEPVNPWGELESGTILFRHGKRL